MKSKGVEPTYSRVLAACPSACKNPETKQPFGKKRVYSVLKERCFDEDENAPWIHKARSLLHMWFWQRLRRVTKGVLWSRLTYGLPIFSFSYVRTSGAWTYTRRS